MFYEATTKVTRTNERGEEKEVLERYVIKDCLLFQEAEERAAKTYAYDNTDGDVVAIRRSKLYEIVNENKTDGKYFKAKLASVFVDEKTGKEKMTYYDLLLNAGSMDEANKIMQEYMKAGMADFLLLSITETKILEVI